MWIFFFWEWVRHWSMAMTTSPHVLEAEKSEVLSWTYLRSKCDILMYTYELTYVYLLSLPYLFWCEINFTRRTLCRGHSLSTLCKFFSITAVWPQTRNHRLIVNSERTPQARDVCATMVSTSLAGCCRLAVPSLFSHGYHTQTKIIRLVRRHNLFAIYINCKRVVIEAI